MKQYLRISETVKRLGMCTKTIQRCDKARKIKYYRTVGRHRRILIVEIARLTEGQEATHESKKRAIYCRVSSHEQKKKGDLTRQMEAARDSWWTPGENIHSFFMTLTVG